MPPRTIPEQLAYTIMQRQNDVGWQDFADMIADAIHSHGEACYNAGVSDGKAQMKPVTRKRNG